MDVQKKQNNNIASFRKHLIIMFKSLNVLFKLVATIKVNTQYFFFGKFKLNTQIHLTHTRICFITNIKKLKQHGCK